MDNVSIEQENKELRRLVNRNDHDYLAAQKETDNLSCELTAAQARVAELEKARLSAMVLVYEPELTHSVWQDYGGLMNEETGEEIIRSQEERINDLKAGVLRGEWVAWRLIRIEKEVMGNE